MENLITMMLPEDEASEEELKEIEEAEIERGEYAILEEVTKEYGVKCPDRVLVSRRAAKFVGEAEERLRKRIISEMKDLENFFTELYDTAKLKGKEDYYRPRIRNIRILFKVNENQRTIYIEKIGYREKYTSRKADRSLPQPIILAIADEIGNENLLKTFLLQITYVKTRN